MELAEGTHRITQDVVNFYLVEEGGKLLLMDAGTPGDRNLLLGCISSLGRGLADLEVRQILERSIRMVGEEMLMFVHARSTSSHTGGGS